MVILCMIVQSVSISEVSAHPEIQIIVLFRFYACFFINHMPENTLDFELADEELLSWKIGLS